MEKEYILFGKTLCIPANPSFDIHIPYLNEMFQEFSEYLSDEDEIMRTIAFHIVSQRHFIGKYGPEKECKISALGKEFAFRATDEELKHYIKAATIVDFLFKLYITPGEDEARFLPLFLLSLTDNIEIDQINYNIEKAKDLLECPSGNMKSMFNCLDQALDALEVWAQRGFDEAHPRPRFYHYLDYHRQDDVIRTLNRLFDAIRLTPQRLDSDSRFKQIDLRIARFRYILTLAPINLYNYSQDRLNLQNALFCSNFEQMRSSAYLEEIRELRTNVHNNNYVRNNKRKFHYLFRGAGNLAVTGSDATRATVAKDLLDLAFVLDEAEQYDYARKAYYNAIQVLNLENPWLAEQEELRSIAFIGHRAMCERRQ